MSLREKENNDFVLIAAKRTAFTKAFKGGFSKIHPDVYLTQLIQKTLEQYSINPMQITSMVFGNVLIPQGGVIEARAAALKAGVPVTVPVMTLNRQCASGLDVLRLIEKEGITMLGGFETMSMHGICSSFCVSKNVDGMIDWKANLKEEDNKCCYGHEKNHKKSIDDLKEDSTCINNRKIESTGCEKRTDRPNEYKTSIKVGEDLQRHAKDCLLTMGQTSENIARKYNVTREDTDLYAFESHTSAYKAQKDGCLAEEIVPICVNPNSNGDNLIIVDIDDGIRKPDFEKLRSLKPVFEPNGVSTAGNSSQLSDGASVSLFTTRAYACKMNLPIQLVFVDIVTVGVDPGLMGIGPVPAINKLLQNNNLKVSDIAYFEINEAFGSQIVACMKELNIPRERLNVNGSGIGIGHPVGATGGRLICVINRLMKNMSNGYGIVSMCAGTGMGTAALFYKE